MRFQRQISTTIQHSGLRNRISILRLIRPIVSSTKLSIWQRRPYCVKIASSLVRQSAEPWLSDLLLSTELTTRRASSCRLQMCECRCYVAGNSCVADRFCATRCSSLKLLPAAASSLFSCCSDPPTLSAASAPVAVAHVVSSLGSHFLHYYSTATETEPTNFRTPKEEVFLQVSSGFLSKFPKSEK